MQIKRKYADPYLLISGDFNQWDLSSALADYHDLQETHVGPTRGNRAIDRSFSNFTEYVFESGLLPPLQTEDSTKKSDHAVTYLRAALPRFEAFEVLTYSYRLYTEEDAEKFHRWVITHDWTRVMQAEGSNAKAEAYQADINCAMDAFFPVRTNTRKSTDPPWISSNIKRRVIYERGQVQEMEKNEKSYY